MLCKGVPRTILTGVSCFTGGQLLKTIANINYAHRQRWGGMGIGGGRDLRALRTVLGRKKRQF